MQRNRKVCIYYAGKILRISGTRRNSGTNYKFLFKIFLDILPEQYKLKHAEEDRDTLIEQSLILIEKSITLIE